MSLIEEEITKSDHDNLLEDLQQDKNYDSDQFYKNSDTQSKAEMAEKNNRQGHYTLKTLPNSPLKKYDKQLQKVYSLKKIKD